MKSRIKEALNFKLKTQQDRQVFYMLFSLFCNAVMLIAQLVLGILTLSIWFFVNAAFNLVIGFARIMSIKDYIKMRYEKNEKLKMEIGYNNYMNNGVLVIVLGVIYLLTSVYMLFNNPSNDLLQGEVIVIGVAAMAFWCLGIAIYDIHKYKKEKDPIVNAIKMTNNANALTMIVLTQVVLLAEFSEGINASTYNAGTSLAMSSVIVFLGIYMLITMKKYLKRSEG